MKATIEQNRKQKDFLDELERRMFGRTKQANRTFFEKCSGAVLPGKHEFERQEAGISAPKASSDLPLPKTYEIKLRSDCKGLQFDQPLLSKTQCPTHRGAYG